MHYSAAISVTAQHQGVCQRSTLRLSQNYGHDVGVLRQMGLPVEQKTILASIVVGVVILLHVLLPEGMISWVMGWKEPETPSPAEKVFFSYVWPCKLHQHQCCARGHSSLCVASVICLWLQRCDDLHGTWFSDHKDRCAFTPQEQYSQKLLFHTWDKPASAHRISPEVTSDCSGAPSLDYCGGNEVRCGGPPVYHILPSSKRGGTWCGALAARRFSGLARPSTCSRAGSQVG